jgi:hypothetical protein
VTCSENTAKHAFLSTPGASLDVQITSSGNSFAGEKYNLTCTVVINGSPDVPIISWNSTISAEETISSGNGTYMSILQFDPLQKSHRDHYQCSVAVADVVEEKIFNLSVQGNFFEYFKSIIIIIIIIIQYQESMPLLVTMDVLQLQASHTLYRVVLAEMKSLTLL